MLHAASHPVLHKFEQAPQENPQVFTHDVQYVVHFSEQRDVQDAAIQLMRQFISHASVPPEPHIAIQPFDTQFLLHPCIQYATQPLLHVVFAPDAAVHVFVHELHSSLQPDVHPVIHPEPHDVLHSHSQLSLQDSIHEFQQPESHDPVQVPRHTPIQFTVQPEEHPRPIPVL